MIRYMAYAGNLDEPFITYPDAKNAVLHFILQADKPIILYGEGSNGKTHLINDINNSIKVTEVIPSGNILQDKLAKLNKGGEIVSTPSLEYLKGLNKDSYHLIDMSKMHWKYDNDKKKSVFSCD